MTEKVAIRWIFRPWRKLPDGTILWAKNYGKKAWRIGRRLKTSAFLKQLAVKTSLPPKLYYSTY